VREVISNIHQLSKTEKTQILRLRRSTYIFLLNSKVVELIQLVRRFWWCFNLVFTPTTSGGNRSQNLAQKPQFFIHEIVSKFNFCCQKSARTEKQALSFILSQFWILLLHSWWIWYLYAPDKTKKMYGAERGVLTPRDWESFCVDSNQCLIQPVMIWRRLAAAAWQKY
jgi:hypothetical protein